MLDHFESDAVLWRTLRPSRPCIPDRRRPTRRSPRSLFVSPRRASRAPFGRPRWPVRRAKRAGVPKCQPQHALSSPSCSCVHRSRPESRSRGSTSTCESPLWPPRLRSPLLRKPQKYAQIVDHLLEHSCLEPSLRLLVEGFPRRQVVRHVSPRRAGAYDPPQPVQDLAKIVLALGASSRTSARYGATNIHSSSETSLGYGFRVAMTRCYRLRAKVHNTL